MSAQTDRGSRFYLKNSYVYLALLTPLLLACFAILGIGVIAYFQYASAAATQPAGGSALTSFLQDNLGMIGTMIVGVLGITVFGLELEARRRTQASQLRLEEEANRKRQDWLERETLKIVEVTDPIAERISEHLTASTEWAIQVLEGAKLGPYSESLFGERSGHFREEKERIAEVFVPSLVCHVNDILEKTDQHVYLIIDSGTTLRPIFRKLAKQVGANRESNPGDDGWEKRVTIVTNSLPGVEDLMEFGRISPRSRYSSLCIGCELLPGKPLPIYSAVTSDTTDSALDHIKTRENNSPCKFIGLTTGNWVLVEKAANGQYYPNPLARGDGHHSFKQKLFDCSDEVFVITPLGKVLFDSNLAEFNAELGYGKTDAPPDKTKYLKLAIPYTDSESGWEKIRLITTGRMSEHVLSTRSIDIYNNFAICDPEIEWPQRAAGTQLQAYQIPFHNLPESRYLQLEVEFPHRPTREDRFLRKFFSI